MAQIRKNLTAGPWERDEAGRPVRSLEVDGRQYRQFDHAKGPVISTPAPPRWDSPSSTQIEQPRYKPQNPWNPSHEASFIGRRQEPPNFHGTSQTPVYSLFPSEPSQNYLLTQNGPFSSPGLQTKNLLAPAFAMSPGDPSTQSYEHPLNNQLKSHDPTLRGPVTPATRANGNELTDDGGPDYATAKGKAGPRHCSQPGIAFQASYGTDRRSGEAGQQIKRNSEARYTVSDGRMRSDALMDEKYTPDIIRRRGTSDELSMELAGLKLSDQLNEDQKRSYQTSVPSPTPIMPTFSDRPPARPISAAAGVDSMSIASSITSGHRCADVDRESLDQRYYKRTNAKKFFVVGRVFAMLWHEDAGQHRRSDLTTLSLPVTSASRYGQPVFSHIRRLVVVRELHGHCWCVPIITYAGRGVVKAGLSPKIREAHAVIYAMGTEPFISPEERGMVTKKPIAITTASSDQKLDKMSRVNFSKVHTVEWNVRVMHVGKVAPESMAAFEGYWHNECGT